MPEETDGGRNASQKWGEGEFFDTWLGSGLATYLVGGEGERVWELGVWALRGLPGGEEKMVGEAKGNVPVLNTVADLGWGCGFFSKPIPPVPALGRQNPDLLLDPGTCKRKKTRVNHK